MNNMEQKQLDFWDNMGDVFGYDIIGSESHPLKKAFELYCEMMDYSEDETDDEDKEVKPKHCDNKPCIGGRAFEIRNCLFCSPNCGNKYFNLTYNDVDYWPEEEDEEEEEI